MGMPLPQWGRPLHGSQDAIRLRQRAVHAFFIEIFLNLQLETKLMTREEFNPCRKNRQMSIVLDSNSWVSGGCGVGVPIDPITRLYLAMCVCMVACKRATLWSNICQLSCTACGGCADGVCVCVCRQQPSFSAVSEDILLVDRIVEKMDKAHR